MISVIIPTLGAAKTLAVPFACLVSPVVSGLVREVIVSDGGSTDDTLAIAEAAGATVVSGKKGRGGQLARGAKEAKGPWLLFLHADTELEPGWEREVSDFIERVASGTARHKVPPGGGLAAAFRYRLNDLSGSARLLERMVALRCALFKLPYGDQALLISKEFYDELGGFADLALMEDIDLVRRIGRRRLVMLHTAAITSAERYHAGGFAFRIMRNTLVMTLWLCRVPTHILVRLYG